MIGGDVVECHHCVTFVTATTTTTTDTDIITCTGPSTTTMTMINFQSLVGIIIAAAAVVVDGC